ncbi:MAG: sulfatase family protein [Planctomycetota bacterium]
MAWFDGLKTKIALLGALALPAVLVIACSAESKPPPNVLLITVDTLRADRVGCYGYGLDTSPNIDGLAARGVRFQDCTVQWPKTYQSLSSFITGKYPKNIPLADGQRKLPPSMKIMSEIFLEAGYATGAVVSNLHVGKSFGFDQGFEHFVESWAEKWKEEDQETSSRRQGGWIKEYTDATLVTDQGLDWLRKTDRERPFFLWLHYMDTHGPYVPPDEYSNLFKGAHPAEPAPRRKLPKYQLQHDSESGKPIYDLAFYRAQYDREIRYVDDQIARLLDWLAEEGLEEDTLIIFTSDHGESFHEHEYYLEHGKLSYQACARVPLIFTHSGALPGGRIVNHPVGVIDVTATIVDLAGLEIPSFFEGRSMADVIHGGEAKGPEFVFMEAGYSSPDTQLTVRSGPWKLIQVRSEADRQLMAGTEYELYNVYEDPHELDNIASEHPQIVDHLSKVLIQWYLSGSPLKNRIKDLDLESLDEKSIEMLRALGYVK